MSSTGTTVSLRIVYTVTVFLSAFLLFQVQLIVAKYILPWYGGSSSVWTTSLLFFQLLLLLGYAYSHLLVSLSIFRNQARLHLILLSLSLLMMTVLLFLWGSPILAAETWKSSNSANPVREIFLLFSVSIGMPFLLLSSTSPLLQRWIGLLQPNRSPYPLYAFSNLGSLAALLSYPFLVEPLLQLHTQAWFWASLYLMFAFSCSVCAFRVMGSRIESNPDAEIARSKNIRQPGGMTLLHWFALTFCSSTLLLAITNQICQEIAVVPFLWVLPLSLYLLSFSICFHHERWYRRRFFLALMAFSTVLSLDILSAPLERTVTDQIVIFSVLLFTACMTCHGELTRQKPPTEHLTSFYFMVALGGASGGVFVGGVAPRLFTGYWELHLGILLSWIVVLLTILRDKKSFMHRPCVRISSLSAGMILLAGFYFMTYPLPGFVQNIGGDSYFFYGLAGLLALISDSFHQIAAYLPAIPRLQLSVLCGLGLLGFVFLTSRSSSAPVALKRSSWLIRVVWSSFLLALALALWSSIDEYYQDAVTVSRNFYGVTKVVEHQTQSGDQVYSLFHGQTLHGLQLRQYPGLPTTYFGDRSGIGILLPNYVRYSSIQNTGRERKIGVLGLGVGTLAAYGRSGDVIRFYEINPDVTRFASGEDSYFTYLADSDATIEIVPGDARITLERELRQSGSQKFDVLVMDAFSSDSVPVHLLTKQAFEVYLRHLRPDGVLAVNVTNRFIDLKPLIYGIGECLGLHLVIIHDTPHDPILQMSTWVLLSFEIRHFTLPPLSLVSSEDLVPGDLSLWTDNFSNLLGLVKP